MSGWLSGWRLALRLARRDALRARGRSVLVLVMIALPVLGVTAADVLLRTQDVNSAESLDRRLGAADARVTVQRGVTTVRQWVDPDQGSWEDGGAGGRPLTAAEVASALGGLRLVPERTGTVAVRTEDGEGDVEAIEVDLRDPVTRGLFRLTSGRWPSRAGEVVVNAALGAKGYAVGDVLDTPSPDNPDPVIVGLAESAATRTSPLAAGPRGSLAVDTAGTRSWLVDGGLVSWPQVLALNARGASVLSRAVVEDPPPMPPQLEEYLAQQNGDMVAVVVLVVVMALIEVVLLAGPAFAVGARRQSRSLALIAASGGTPAQSRRVVLGSAVVLGGTASVIGVVAGIGAGRLLVPVLQARSDSWFGPFEVPWPHLLGIVGFGLLSALLASVVPAWIASRQDVVAVLAGRRGDRRASLRSPVLGVVLLGGGVAAAAYGATSPEAVRGAYLIAGAAIASVLGMILLVPVVLVLVAAVSARLPLPLRYATRDASRHRSRTVPAVAAVAATVSGVVALGIAVSSDEAESRASYLPSVASGVGLLDTDSDPGASGWRALRDVVEREAAGATVTEVQGLAAPEGGYLDVQISRHHQGFLDSYGSALGSDVLVSDGALPPGLLGLSEAGRNRAEEALAKGGMVAFTDLGGTDGPVKVRVRGAEDGGRDLRIARGRLDATVVPLDRPQAGPQAVLSPAAAGRLGVAVSTVALAVTGGVSPDQEQAVTEGAAALDAGATFSVERGYQTDNETAIIELVLFALGAVLMLGGTLTATFLALSDARPDLATLSAVGAAPRTRRGVAASYAVFVGVVGAVLGVLVGFIPGVAVTYPLTGNGYVPAGVNVPSHYLDVPWLMVLGLVVALPLLTAAVVGLTVRSRLPLVARLD